jgi:acetylornithine deacetylase/succinyl-diaminopimelate desuccinylase-like protein
MRSMDLFDAAPLMHGKDERVRVEDLALAAGFYSELVQEVLG